MAIFVCISMLRFFSVISGNALMAAAKPGAIAAVGSSSPGDDDMLALFFSLLMIMLRNKHPVFLLPAMVGIEAAEQEYEFSEALNANPDLLDALEQDNILRFPPGAVRNVLRGMGKLEWDERLLPKDALTLLHTREPDTGPLASFMQTMFPHG